jgi:CubicO group peptidase (beta-lactamase class C family)
VLNGLLPANVIAGQPVPKRTLQEAMTELNVLGVSIAAIRNGVIDWQRGVGITRASGPAVTTTTPFQAGSATHGLTAVAVQMALSGRFSIDVPVNTVLTGWRLPDTPPIPASGVTVRNILNNTSGLRGGTFTGYTRIEPVPTIAQILDGLAPSRSSAVRIESLPGNFRRAASGFLLAQLVTESASGQGFAAFVNQQIFVPLGMTSSNFEQPASATTGQNAAWPHPEPWRPNITEPFTFPELGSHGWWTTAGDMARFITGVQASINGVAGALLPVAAAVATTTPDGNNSGLGFAATAVGTVRRFSASGTNRGYHAFMVGYTDGNGLAVMCNADRPQLISEILRAASAEYNWVDGKPTTITPVTVSTTALGAFVGTWTITNIAGMPLSIALVGNELRATFPDGIVANLVPTSPNTFVTLWHNYQIDFSTTTPGTGTVRFTLGVSPISRI